MKPIRFTRGNTTYVVTGIIKDKNGNFFTGANLPDQMMVIPGGLGHTLLPVGQTGQGPTGKPYTTKDLIAELAAGFQTTCYDGPQITPALLDNQEQIIGVWLIRFDADPDQPVLATPAHIELIDPAVQAVVDGAALLNDEEPSVLRNEDLQQVAEARQAVADSQRVLDNVGPLVQGATAKRAAALNVLAGFLTRVNKNATPAMERSFILGKKLAPVQAWADATANAAAETKHLTQVVAHKTEAETLNRVKETLGQGAAASSGAGGAGGIIQGGQGAQGAVPPGAMPVTLPDPVHEKPKRKGAGATAGKRKAKGTPSKPTPPSTK